MAENEEKIVIRKNVNKKSTSKPSNKKKTKDENLESNDLQEELDEGTEENDTHDDNSDREKDSENKKEKKSENKKSSNGNKKNTNRSKSNSSTNNTSNVGPKNTNGSSGTTSAGKITPTGNPIGGSGGASTLPGAGTTGAAGSAGATGAAGGAGAAGAAGGAGAAGAAGGAGAAGAAGGAGAAGAAGGAGAAGAGAAAGGAGIGIPILIILLIILVIIVISVAVNKSNAENEIKKAKEGKSSIKAAVESGQLPGTQEQIDNAMAYSDKYNSYIGFTTDQINYLYNYAIDEKGASTERKAVIKEYKTKYGKMPKDRSGILTVDNNQEIYKHILNTEKYNFNKIKWVNYSHNQEGSKEIEKDDLYKDKELGLMYPDDKSTKRETFIEMASPYLLSNSIPLGFLTASATTDSNKEYRPSAQEIFDQMYGAQDNSSNENARNKATFAYEILKYAQSDITIDQYQLKHYTLNTYYLDYDTTTYQDTIIVNVDVGFSLENIVGDILSAINPSNAHCGVASVSTKSFEDTTHTNTRWNENKTEDVMKEDFISENSKYENIYYVSTAKAFDVVFNASYNYTKYNDDDAKKRRNSDSEYTTPSDYLKIDNENHRVGDNGVNGETPAQIASNYGGSLKLLSDNLDIGNGQAHYTAQFEIICGEYKINEGKRYDIQRKWDDKVVPGSTSKRVFQEEELYEFDSNSEGDNDKTTISKETLSSHADIEHYKDLVGNSELNSIDILDSNPGIFLKYVSSNFRQSEYIGYGRGGTSYISSVGYDNVKTYLDEIAVDKKLPFIYGSSLGYDVDTMSSSSGFSTGSQLLKEYIRALEGGGATTEKDGKSYYTVLDVLGHPTVGYGLDLTAHPEWKSEIMSAMGVSSLGVGDLADVEICDKIEDDFRNAKLDKIKSQYDSLELKEYQIHALVARTYNVGNVDGYGSAHAQYYNAATDDKYEQVYEQYKDNSGAVSEISSKADLNSALYTNYMSKPVTAQGNEGVITGLVNRRMSEWVLFSLGYYDKLQKFWTAGGDGNFGGISVIDGSGNVDKDACLQLQSALQNEIFGGRLVAPAISVGNLFGNNIPTGSANTDSNGYLTDAYRSFFATSYYYQCPWWSRGRANIYLHSVDPNKYNGQFIRDGLGNGVDLAAGVARAYGIPLYNDVSQLRANSIISYDNGTSWGHTAYVEAVGNDYYVVSHCGSGKNWHGISVIPKTQSAGSFRVNGFVCMDDLIAK